MRDARVKRFLWRTQNAWVMPQFFPSVGLAMIALSVQLPAYAVEYIEAATRQGDSVRLYPNGRWEYMDAKKAEIQRQQVEKIEANTSPVQGRLFGLGRRIEPGEPDYNRGSLNPKMR